MAPTRSQAVARIRAICLGLPEAVEKPFGGHTSPAFRVRDKMFVVVSEDRASMTVKAPKGVQAILINSDPGAILRPQVRRAARGGWGSGSIRTSRPTGRKWPR